MHSSGPPRRLVFIPIARLSTYLLFQQLISIFSIQALVLCETLGLASLDSCWAHGILVRYLDVIRVTRASWHEIGSWIRDALDLGLHRDGSSFKLPKEQVAARRILWSHTLHNDREWSILLGRPLTITFHTTEMPTREDLEPLGFACQTYLLARNRFTACLEAITHCFQERSQPVGQTAGRASRSYYKVLEVDDMIAEFLDSLPPYLAPGTTTSGKSKVDTSLDEHHPQLPYYRHIMNSEVCFYRSLLHRPYLLRPAVGGKHPFPESRRICVETALNDLRARKAYASKLTKEEIAQAFGGAYAMVSTTSSFLPTLSTELTDSSLHTVQFCHCCWSVPIDSLQPR